MSLTAAAVAVHSDSSETRDSPPLGIGDKEGKKNVNLLVRAYKL